MNLADQDPANNYSTRTLVQEKETVPATKDTEAKSKQVLEAGKHNQNEGDKNLKETEQTLDLAALFDSDNQVVTETEAKDKQVVEFKISSSAESSTLTESLGKQNKNGRETDLKQKEENQDFAMAIVTANMSSSLEEQDENNSTMLVHTQACNYAKGKWVVDDTRPLYSGFGCKQWLAQMWACRLMQRTDFAYEKLRWQPNNCQMEEFEGEKFLKRMQDKTLAFVGDSLGRQQFLSIMCMITGGKERHDVIDVGHEYGFVKPHGGVRPNGWAYRFPSTNTTVLYYWSACLCDLEPIDIKNPPTDYAMHLDRPPAFLRLFLHKIDVLVLNTGHHWNRGKLRANRWVMHVGGMPNTNKKLAMIGDAKNFTIHSIINWVNMQLPKNPRLKAFYRSISPRHFVHGDWNTGGSCDKTTPMSIGKEVLQDESSDYSAGHAVKGTGVQLLDITALSQVRDEGHISRYSITASPGVQDCLHWCLPGVPDTWNEILFAQISDISQVQNE
ncbi:hypothetical protein JCGZ_07503 [Jatropha curcas]|uniref:Uncharacterized protein n=2 Tax=Jatropha curcas TaxID=180498 RepID=A0A067KCR2_JATCU|nr:protein trichome birefringence-like 16 isoform X2 [Jatropha curcas]KDP33932.1 hypothetical protein JCGZ_07503 [Jatropha curcas]